MLFFRYFGPSCLRPTFIMPADLGGVELPVVDRKAKQLTRPAVALPRRVADNQPARESRSGKPKLPGQLGQNTTRVNRCTVCARGDRQKDWSWPAKDIAY